MGRATWRRSRLIVAVTVMALVGAVMAAPVSAQDKPDDKKSKTVELQILALNDFHGNINTLSSSFGGTGGAQNLATNIAAAEAGVRNSIFVSAGDLIGASPLISALFHDEPTIEVMNQIGLDINGVGNHEFDEGPAELLRMQEGGSHPVDGDLDADGFEGAEFDFLSANVTVDETGKTLFPAYTIKNYQGVKVAFIGLTLEGTPTIVTPSGVAGLTFDDEAETVNSIVRQLRNKTNIESFVILLHEGGMSDGGQNDCGTTLTGPIATIVPQFDDAVDVVIAGHTNDEFICEIDGKTVTMADNAGRLFTDIDVTLDKKTKDMTVVSVNNVANLQTATDDPDVQAIIDKYATLSAPLANTVIGSITGDIVRAANPAGESALGDVIADAQLAATTAPELGGAVVAFMNAGGIRENLVHAQISGTEALGEVTYGEAFTVQPFGNSLVTMTLTGTQIEALLEQQFTGGNGILQVSNGFSYEWSLTAPAGDKIDPASIMLNGSMVEPGATYRVTVNNFLADGGDNYTVLVGGTDRLGGEVDLDAFTAYIEANSPLGQTAPAGRIVQIP
jgi:5'-nucleotidase